MVTQTFQEVLDTALFDDLSLDEIAEVMRYVTVARYSRGQFIFYTGDPADAFYVLQAGMVKVSYSNLRGDEKIVSIAQSGDVFGEMFLGQYRTRIGIATALDSVVVGKITEQDFLYLMQRIPRFGMNFVSYLADTKRQALAWMHALMHMEARDRLLGTLLNLARRYCCTKNEWFTLPHCITQEDIANLTCLNRSTVNVLINDLRKQGVLGGSGRTLTVNHTEVVRILHESGVEILE